MADKEKAIRILEGNYKNSVLRHNGELLTVNELIELLKAQDPIEPIQDMVGDALLWVCGKCGHDIRNSDWYCANCGKKVKWE